MASGTSCAIVILALLLKGTVSSAEPVVYVNAESLEAAKALVETMGGNTLAWQLISGSRGVMMYKLVSEYHATPETAYSATDEILLPALRERIGEFKSRIARIYARHFSAQELMTVKLFYESPGGKKMDRP